MNKNTEEVICPECKKPFQRRIKINKKVRLGKKVRKSTAKTCSRKCGRKYAVRMYKIWKKK